MSATFDETLPTEKDEARELLGDSIVIPGTTLVASPLRSDARILAAIARKGFLLGVALLADGLVTEFGQQPVQLGENGASISFAARVPAWQALASRMRAQAAEEAAAAGQALTGGVIALAFQEDLEEELDDDA